jgi:hypothetical protein
MTASATEDDLLYTEERLHKIHDDAKARGDDEAAGLAHAMLWAHEFCDRAKDAATALAREARRVLPILALSVDGDGSIVERVAKPLREMITELLDEPRPALDPPERVESDEDGQPKYNIPLTHWAMRTLAESLAKTCKNAPNFVSGFTLNTPDGPFVFTLQKPGGKAPGDLVAELKAEIAALKAGQTELAALREVEKAGLVLVNEAQRASFDKAFAYEIDRNFRDALAAVEKLRAAARAAADR